MRRRQNGKLKGRLKMTEYIKKPCAHCPFRIDVKPFLHPERAEELAYAAQNPYSTFTCHKTLEYDEEEDDNFTGEESKVCAGFLTLQHFELGETSYGEDGFEPSDNCYEGSHEMVEAYEEEWNNGKSGH